MSCLFLLGNGCNSCVMCEKRRGNSWSLFSPVYYIDSGIVTGGEFFSGGRAIVLVCVRSYVLSLGLQIWRLVMGK